MADVRPALDINLGFYITCFQSAHAFVGTQYLYMRLTSAALQANDCECECWRSFGTAKLWLLTNGLLCDTDGVCDAGPTCWPCSDRPANVADESGWAMDLVDWWLRLDGCETVGRDIPLRLILVVCDFSSSGH